VAVLLGPAVAFIYSRVKTETQKIGICNTKLVNDSLLARVSDRLLTVAITWSKEPLDLYDAEKYHLLTIGEYILHVHE